MNINVTLLWQMVFFVIFVWFTKKFVWTPIIGVINERKTTIADGLAAAEKGQRAEEDGLKKAEEVVADAKTRATEIISRAEKHGQELVEEAKSRARTEGERIVASAQDDIQTELNKAREALRGQVGELAVEGARKILDREIDSRAHADLLDRLAAKL
ncbi:MAG: F0F1 ATP synthase subunit B [Gammaproteobacteria bacterium]|nr:F0F1 ATP synthase subunit B [Gammaproteobacteria bacterium]MDE0714136.1 F0F1 ATP synthase subunit B [Gammaproteobacteria bacterium]MXX17737.1 F0F1 ATP synthase subunit B [Gammaproteobacteria bacterium]MXY63673.1 F0F1 ATP synthase subunit B [Gammaproteobacteria bacterium]MYG67028.1 F0F1 ATP synthase subunit B [Gammaproteobacteria bacterium]